MQSYGDQRLEQNVYAAIRALESERFYEFSDGLLELLRKAKNTDRMLGSVLDSTCGVPFEETQERLRKAETLNTWWSDDRL